ncbi:5-aminolevulinate synthase [Pseudorhodobacter sp.]|uniref:5-aminolevulinate synthase n=1 Tax=Pseudorhodobacter sp. TaxID=1934400 RepID=UPI0026471E0F|nr:5-aminolevulinate synthase [Pseudorhodobacter sp.]MDN5786716.1 5-aminolevulinate synthase [Pseudorhodobacter sp.]
MSFLPATQFTLANPATIAFVVLSSVGYATVTIGLKMGSASMTALSITVILIGLAAAMFGEITALRSVALGPIYIAILGMETLIVMTYTWYIGEALSARQIGGAGMVMFGLLLVNT